MGIKQKDENSAGGLHNALAAGTTIKGTKRTVQRSLLDVFREKESGQID